MLISHDDEKAWERAGKPALEAAKREAVQLAQEMHARGQYVLASPLQPAATATNVRVRDGKRLVTDGPYAETREVLGGFYIVDVKDVAEAVAIAARHPGARFGTVEVRAMADMPGLPAGG
jgi:hypothetical protein